MANVTYSFPLAVGTATIADAGNLSDAVAMQGARPVALLTADGLDAAALTFQGSPDGVTYANLYNAAGEISYPVGATARMVALDPADFLGCAYIKIRSGTAGSPTTQSPAAAITVIGATIT
jgi:hypothetical protein